MHDPSNISHTVTRACTNSMLSNMSWSSLSLVHSIVIQTQPDWLTAQTFMGITTFYKYDPDGSLWVKLHGTMEDVRLIDQLATIREVDLFKHWIPFCDKSSLLKRIGIIEVLAYFNTTLPGISRWVVHKIVILQGCCVP